MKLADCFLCVVVRGHLDKRKASCSTRGLVAHDAHIVDCSGPAEELGEFFVRGFVGEVAHVQSAAHRCETLSRASFCLPEARRRASDGTPVKRSQLWAFGDTYGLRNAQQAGVTAEYIAERGPTRAVKAKLHRDARVGQMGAGRGRSGGLLSLLVGLGLPGCSTSETRVYPLHGQILEIRPDVQEVLIKHGDIVGFMPGMTMPFKLRDPRLLTGRVPGDLVTAQLRRGCDVRLHPLSAPAVLPSPGPTLC